MTEFQLPDEFLAVRRKGNEFPGIRLKLSETTPDALDTLSTLVAMASRTAFQNGNTNWGCSLTRDAARIRRRAARMRETA
jgi:hypothetical protein